MVRTNQTPIARPLPITTQEYDPVSAEVQRRTIEQNFEELYAQLGVVKGAPEREESLLAFESSLIQGHVVVQDDGTLADFDPSLYALKAGTETITGAWNFTTAPTISGSAIVTAANLETQLEALTTTDLDMSSVDQLQIGDSLVFTGNTTDWTIDGSTAPLLFSFGATEVFRIDPNSERVQIRDSSGNLRFRFYALDTNPAFLMQGNTPSIYIYEDDAPTNEGFTGFRMTGGAFRCWSFTDAGSIQNELFLFNRNGLEWDFGELNVADMRWRTNTYSASDVDVYQRYYPKGTGQWVLERRRESDSLLAWRFVGPSNGDFYLQSFNYSGSGSPDDTWLFGDASTGDFTIGTDQVGSNIILDPESFVEVDSQIIQTGGTTVQVTTSGTYTVPWDDGWAFTIYVTGTTTVDVDGSECRQSGMYLLQVTNDSGASRTVSISGVDFWENAAPNTTLTDSRTHVIALYVVASRTGSFSRVVGHTLVDNSFLF